jgi:hypothetical protein
MLDKLTKFIAENPTIIIGLVLFLIVIIIILIIKNWNISVPFISSSKDKYVPEMKKDVLKSSDEKEETDKKDIDIRKNKNPEISKLVNDLNNS